MFYNFIITSSFVTGILTRCGSFVNTEYEVCEVLTIVFDTGDFVPS